MKRLTLGVVTVVACASDPSAPGPATATVVADVGNEIHAMAGRGDVLYCGTTGGNYDLQRVSKTDGAVQLFGPNEPLVGIATTATSEGGGAPATIGIVVGADAGSSRMTAPVVDETSVYFGLGARVYKVPR